MTQQLWHQRIIPNERHYVDDDNNDNNDNDAYKQHIQDQKGYFSLWKGFENDSNGRRT